MWLASGEGEEEEEEVAHGKWVEVFEGFEEGFPADFTQICCTDFTQIFQITRSQKSV